MLSRAAGLSASAALVCAGLISGCSSNSVTPEIAATPANASTAGGAPARGPETTTPTPQVRVPSGVVGAGCENYVLRVPDGPGALDGMGRDPVVVALGNSPLLTTLAGALTGKLNPDVNLFDPMNTGQFTVFAPTDDAFGKLAPETIDKFKNDPKLLTAVLNYHVVPGQIGPDDIVGEHKTLQGQPLTVSGSGDNLRVNDAGVVCGGIKTANATVYLVDTVLTIPAVPPTTTATSGSETTASTTPSPTQ